jgi:hypothetical protein
MATESSAVVRFINLAQQAQNPVLPSAPPPPVTSDFGTEVLRPAVRARSNRVPLILGAIFLAGAAAGLGVFLGRSGFASDEDDSSAPAAAAVTAPVAEERAPIAAGAPASAPAASDQAASAPAPEPQVTSPAVSVPSDVLAATGFDIRVEPGATITLDGSVLGKAPLRVRNLQPGAHVIDVEAPAGYFSRRMEIALGAGEAKELRLALDRIEDDAVAATAAAPADTSDAAPARRSRADLRRERREKMREEKERRKEMRATRVAAAKAAKAAARSGKQARPEVTTQPLPAAKKDSDSAADAELEAAMAEITGKPVASNKSAPVSAGASLTASPAAGAGNGTLMLGSKPPCDIVIDGKSTGLKTPQRAMELAPGTHRVTLVNKELGLEKNFKVKIAAGKTTKAIQDLTSKLD